MSDQPRHEQLVAAGWRYDANQDRYAAPGSPTDGTERWFNLAAAWAEYQASKDDAASERQAPRVARKRDPREQEPL